MIWSSSAIGAAGVDVNSKDGSVYVSRNIASVNGTIIRSQNLAKLDPTDGHEIWVIPTPGSIYDGGMGVTVDQLEGSVYFAWTGGFSKLDPSDGHVIWNAQPIGGYPEGAAVERPLSDYILDIPGAPTIGTATAGNGQATVTFTAPASDGNSAITNYTVTSNPGNITATGSASPITVTGLTNGTSYTFTVTATNAVGTSLASGASISIVPDDGDGIAAIVDRNESTGADESSIYSNDFNDGSTYGTIADRGGWNVSVTKVETGGVQIKVDGSGTGIAKIISCSNNVETQLDAAGETVNLSCGSTDVTAVVASPKIVVREPGSSVKGKAVKVSLTTGQSVKMGSYVLAGADNTEPISVEILDENNTVIGSGSLTANQDVDIVTDSPDGNVVLNNLGSTPISFVLDGASLNIAPGENFEDLCPNSVVDPTPLPNNYSWTGGANFMTTDSKTKQLVASGYTMLQTNGCSCAQILAGTSGQEKGQLKNGCTKETLDKYIAQTHGVAVQTENTSIFGRIGMFFSNVVSGVAAVFMSLFK